MLTLNYGFWTSFFFNPLLLNMVFRLCQHTTGWFLIFVHLNSIVELHMELCNMEEDAML